MDFILDWDSLDAADALLSSSGVALDAQAGIDSLRFEPLGHDDAFCEAFIDHSQLSSSLHLEMDLDFEDELNDHERSEKLNDMTENEQDSHSLKVADDFTEESDDRRQVGSFNLLKYLMVVAELTRSLQ